MSQTRFINPQALGKPPGYTHVVEVTAPGRISITDVIVDASGVPRKKLLPYCTTSGVDAIVGRGPWKR